MKKVKIHAINLLILLSVCGCRTETKTVDRSGASEMYARMSRLTENYTKKLASVSDSASWANLCKEYEDSLDKISFSYPPDTDLLMTEGQNDSVHKLMEEYIRIREEKIEEILHPYLPADTIPVDSVEMNKSEMVPIR